MAIKGAVSADGTRNRLFPLTINTNEHVLPVYNKPLIDYPIQALGNAEIEKALVVTRERSTKDFLWLLADRKKLRLTRLDYTSRQGEGGITDALSLVSPLGGGHRICAILDNNIVEGSIREALDGFRKQLSGAKIMIKQVSEAEHLGTAEIAAGNIIAIEEKNRKLKSSLPVLEIYVYEEARFDKVQNTKRSDGGNFEVTEIHKNYVARTKEREQ